MLSIVFFVDSRLLLFYAVSLSVRSRFSMVSSCLDDICWRWEFFFATTAPISLIVSPATCCMSLLAVEISFLFGSSAGLPVLAASDRELDMENSNTHTVGTHKERPANASNPPPNYDHSRSQNTQSLQGVPKSLIRGPIHLLPSPPSFGNTEPDLRLHKHHRGHGGLSTRNVHGRRLGLSSHVPTGSCSRDFLSHDVRRIADKICPRLNVTETGEVDVQ